MRWAADNTCRMRGCGRVALWCGLCACTIGANAAAAPPKQDGTATQPVRPTPPPEDPLPGLDDLLGLPGEARPPREPADGEAGEGAERAKTDLDRKLELQEAAEQFKLAVELMGQTADRLERDADTGLATQRIQEDIIRKLDTLIAAAKRRQSQSSSSSSSQQQQDQQSQPAQRQGGGRPQQTRGDGNNPGNLPSRQDGALRPTLSGTGAAWGSLPARVRDALRQGSSDRFSSLYEAMTESYYRRLAEEGGK